ncbi:SUMF1/EgtB/PvdO family nonheme iron enzyme [Scytonema sp. UIC 10036]|uniref:SUMF1/EgtB/PvdO family nonheme iron enzyme n=1 Tax=Scytonema sp. UIC 10036 TaxID=2304196 RepID=UPI0013841993|nr:SUMF1/EgtB/PvdO family nonheme iron enzyme [Scytonema sp. UIC 10036]
MKPLNDHHLLELFQGLRKARLSLRIEDYQLLCQAWEKGFRPNNIQELGELCRRLWVKSLKEQQLFDGYFKKYRDQCLEQLIQSVFQPETNSSSDETNPSSSDESSGEGRKLTKGSSRVAQPDILQENLQHKGDETSPQTTSTESPLLETVITEAARVGQAVPIPRSTDFTLTKEYFPVHRRQMQQSWRKLRLPLREGMGTELDIPATIKRVSQKGLFLDPVLIPRRTNQTELLLLLDQSNSMMPFAPLAEQLVQTARKDGRLGETKTYYFRNTPKDSLFSDLDLLQKQPLTDIIPHLHKNRTVVLIFSDGGAARGGYNQERVKLTEKFLKQLKPEVRQVVWLNPIPKYRWFGTTASQLSEKVFMYPFSEQGWRVMIDVLRGKQEPPPAEDYEYLIDWSELVANQESVEQLYKRLVRLQPANIKNNPDELYRYENASLYIADFARRGQAYLDLACHAAFPLAITPDLVYYLRENFSFFDQKGKKLNIPWIAVPDLLLSNLCYPIGYQLYEMDSAVRHLLLKLLQQEERFGNKRLDELSDCLLYYLQQGLNNPNLKNQDFGENPQWIALAYTKPTEVARQLALMLRQTYSGDKAEKIKSVSLTATFTEPLAEANFQPLLTFARGWGRLARGYEEDAKEVFEQLPKKSPQLNVEGVKLWIPGRKLLQFSFDVVTLNASGEVIKRETHQAKYFREDLGNRVTLDMVYIPGGRFLMGSPETEEGRDEDEGPQHEVTVQPFFMGKYPVTQKQWRVVAAFPQVNRELDPDPSNFKGVNRPVEQVSWYDAIEFCDRLSKYTGKNYRLPSEAEWEYACRAGTTTPFHFGETITPEFVNYDGNYTYASSTKGKSHEKTTTVGSFKVANKFGLFDMHGNIREWCTDCWHENYESAPSDGSPWFDENDNLRLLRGGSWNYNPRHCRSAYRNCDDPDNVYDIFGFRVVVSGARTQ